MNGSVLLEKIHQIVVQNPKKVVLFFFVLTLVLSYGLTYTKFSQSYEDFLPHDTKAYDDYKILQDSFSDSKNFLFIVIEPENRLLSKYVINAINEITKKIEALSSTNFALSLSNVNNPIISPIGQVYNRYYFKNPRHYTRDSLKLSQESLYADLLLSRDGKKTAIYIENKSGLSLDESAKYLNEIDTILLDYQNKKLGKLEITGLLSTEKEIINLINKEFSSSILFISIILLLGLWFIFRSFSISIISALVIIFPMLWVLGVIGYLGIPTNIITLALPAIILTVGTSDVIHIAMYYFNNLNKCTDSKSALKTVFTKLGLSTFFTSITTSIGFLSLNTTSLEPVRDLGTNTAIGVLFTFTSAFILLPAMLVLFEKRVIKFKASSARQIKIYSTLLTKVFIFSIRNRISLIISLSIVLILAIIGVSKLRVTTYLVEDMKSDFPIKQRSVLIDSEFAGVRSFELLVFLKDKHKDKKISDSLIIKEINRIDIYLKDSLHIRAMLSPAIVIKKLNRSLHLGRKEAEVLPDNWSAVIPYWKKIIQDTANNLQVVNSSETIGRISGKLPDIGSEKAFMMEERLLNYLKSNPTTYLDLRQTGNAYLVDLNNTLLAKSCLLGFLIGMLLIFICMLFITRSLPLSLLAISINIISVLVIAGLMGWLNVRCRLITMIIFSIVFGITIDNLIHFLARYTIDFKSHQHLNPLRRLKRSYIASGKGIVMSTMMLLIGFLSLLISNFLGIILFGIFISITFIIALVVVMMILPAMLSFRKK